jgi:hypothetical protein
VRARVVDEVPTIRQWLRRKLREAQLSRYP